MGYYSEYIGKQLNFSQLTAERTKQLQLISNHRKRDVLVFAANLGASNASISINYTGPTLPLFLHNLL